ncbi:MAG: hypothetical protein KUG79_13645 [Pseudomonadales bacterium]|nr:hypothetical protein [Pseudomonadales bacterium]
MISIVGCGSGSGGSSAADENNNQGADPVIVDFPIFFIRRPFTPTNINDAEDDAQEIVIAPGVLPTPPAITPRRLDVFEPGAQLIFKDRAISSAAERNISDQAFSTDSNGNRPVYDVRDLEPDFDGKRLVFSMRGPFDPDSDDQPSWNIWLYDITTETLGRVISSDTVAEAGQDRDPHFLPDGSIVFTSDRQRRSRALLLDEGRPQFPALDEDRREQASVLHKMNDNGTNITQLSFNQSHDQDPLILRDGRIAFNRWDNTPGRDVISLYRLNPDGSQLEHLYGYHSQNSGRDGSDILFLEPREMTDGQLLVIGKSSQPNQIGGDLLFLDIDNFVEIDQPTNANTGLISNGQSSPLSTLVSLDGPSARGRFASAYPLYDNTNRLLITWSQCRLIEPADTAEDKIVPCTAERLNDTDNPAIEAPPLFGLWILNLDDDTQQPIIPPTEGVALTEAVVMSPRPAPFFLQPNPADPMTQTLINENAGILHIKSIFDIDGSDTAVPDLTTLANPSITSSAERRRLFLRIIKPVSLPPREVVNLPGTAFGRSQNQLMREIIGYANIHPDGSVYVKVPANIAFSISILDPDGRRISPLHRNWLQLKPGETLTCHGCHTTDSQQPHGRRDAQPASINTGGPFAGLAADFLVNPGQTMAEAFANFGELPAPNFDVEFTDIWTNPANRAIDPEFAFRYQDLNTDIPLQPSCADTWQATCRATIHYEQHIHPLWSVDRRVFEQDGLTLIADQTCTACHSDTDQLGLTQIPAAQLELSGATSSDQNDHLISYRELLFNDAEQEIIDNQLVNRMIPVLGNNGQPLFEMDADEELILDIAGNPIPILQTVTVSPSMSTAGANSSNGFFNLFENNGSHADYLTKAELRLLSEWLDIGAQYYNDPFKVPQ